MSLHKKQPSFMVKYETEIKLSLFLLVWFLILLIFLLINDTRMGAL
jgi:hypothetical protein